MGKEKPANKISKFSTPNRDKLKLINKAKSIKERLGDVKSNISKLNNRLKILDRKQYMYKTLAAGANEFPNTPVISNMSDPKSLRDLTKTDNVVKATRLGIGALKTVKGVGMGLALNYLSDRFLAPHVRTAGWKLGQALVPVGRKIDQLRIRNMKDGE